MNKNICITQNSHDNFQHFLLNRNHTKFGKIKEEEKKYSLLWANDIIFPLIIVRIILRNKWFKKLILSLCYQLKSTKLFSNFLESDVGLPAGASKDGQHFGEVLLWVQSILVLQTFWPWIKHLNLVCFILDIPLITFHGNIHLLH